MQDLTLDHSLTANSGKAGFRLCREKNPGRGRSDRHTANLYWIEVR